MTFRLLTLLAPCVVWSCTVAPSEVTHRGTDSASVPRPAVQVYDAIWPAVDTMMSQTWDGNHGHALRLDRRALAHGAGAADAGEIVTAAEADRWIALGYVIGQCPPLAANGRCATGDATMMVQFSPVVWRGDAAEVDLELYREGFGATWTILLVRDGTRWQVRSRRMTRIT